MIHVDIKVCGEMGMVGGRGGEEERAEKGC